MVVFDGMLSVLPLVSVMVVADGKSAGSKVMMPPLAAAAAASVSRRLQFDSGQLPGVPVASSDAVVTTNDGGGLTVSVKTWMAFGTTPLLAVMASE